MSTIVNEHTFVRSLYRKISESQETLRDVSFQIASNERFQNFKGFASEGNIEKVISFQSQIDDLKIFNSNNERVITRLETMEEAMSTLQDIAENFLSTLVKKRSAVGDNVPVLIEAEAALEQVQQNLNLRSEGRYLFSGSKTDTAPVANIVATTNVSGTSSTSNYYRGDDVTLATRISETQDFEYGVKASEKGFQNLIGAIHLAIDGTNNNSDVTLQDAVDMMNTAVSELASIRGDISNNASIIRNVTDSNTNIQILISTSFEKITKTDIVEASTIMAELEAQIEASFISWNILAKLNLSDFI